MSFAAATAIGRLDESTYSAEIHPGWDIAGNANGGYLEEDGKVWDAAGRLIAQSRQLALVPRG